MKDKIKFLRTNPLIVNSVFLMIATGATAGFGFIFWAIVARNFQDSSVGLAATLLSISSLVSLLSLAGFDTTFVRFLPKSNRKSDYISSGLLITALITMILSAGFAISFPIISPSLSFVSHNFYYFFIFVFINICTTLNTLTNSVFLAYKKTLYILLINILFSLAKVLLPFIISSGSAMTIFIIAGASQLVGLIISLWAMLKKLDIKLSFKVHFDILKLSKKFALAAYSSSILNLLPPTVLPLIVTHKIGASASAYYFMAFTIANLLYTIAYSSMQSVFAEGSHNEEQLGSHLRKGLKFISLLIVPSMLVLYFVSPYILSVFGQNYSHNGATLLRILAISAIFVSTYSSLGTLFKVRRDTGSLVIMNVIYVVVILAVSFIFSRKYGLTIIGYAWLLGNIAATLAGLTLFGIKKAQPETQLISLNSRTQL